jgi:hypothetical protein
MSYIVPRMIKLGQRQAPEGRDEKQRAVSPKRNAPNRGTTSRCRHNAPKLSPHRHHHTNVGNPDLAQEGSDQAPVPPIHPPRQRHPDDFSTHLQPCRGGRPQAPPPPGPWTASGPCHHQHLLYSRLKRLGCF